ncbi:MAG: heavy-metal-associated domain-containing protein [Rhodospirillaceae bacterium]|nr:heavy-metal-associated domain-containing protein [Rhodospirillaceae bacterium]
MRYTLSMAIMLVHAAPVAHAETIIATVNGMVCAFCATGIEKSFKKQSAVAEILVDLEHKKVTVHTKPERTLDDTLVTKLITDAGYAVVGIERRP